MNAVIGTPSDRIILPLCLQQLAERRISVQTESADFRTQGIVQRFFDCIAHFFLYFLYHNYHDFYENRLAQRIAGANPSLPLHSSVNNPSNEEHPSEISPLKKKEEAWDDAGLKESSGRIDRLYHPTSSVNSPSSSTEHLIHPADAPQIKERQVVLETGLLEPLALSAHDPCRGAVRNLVKAFIEHDESEPGVYALFSIDSLNTKTLENQESRLPLVIKGGQAEAQGLRPTMEDACVLVERGDWVLAGVFDGHGGSEVADILRGKFAEMFFLMLPHDLTLARSECILDALNQTFCHIQHHCLNERHSSQGSTAVVSVMNRKTGLIYTATLGDSETNIYRKNEEEQLKSIPLSCVRNWGSKKDMDRLVRMYQPPSMYEASLESGPVKSEEEIDAQIQHYQHDLKAKYMQEIADGSNPKHLRVAPKGLPEKFRMKGLNVSRSVGDADFRDDQLQAGVTEKPKITMYQVKPGDLVVLACDGLKDYVKEADVVQHIDENSFLEPNDLADSLVNYAIWDQGSKDNVTVLVLRVTGGSEPV